LREQCFRRDDGRCTVAGCPMPGTVADHIETRPDVPYSTPQDVLENLRTLCKSHDAQVKERRRGQALTRKQSGNFRLRGCDVEGWPLEPMHRR
jgi:5-methylcytosine-specific restriction endonuclease McrA